MKYIITFAAIICAISYTNTSVANSIYADVIGDAKIGGSDQGEIPIDISKIHVFYDDNIYYIYINFDPSSPIAPPSLGLPNSITGVIEFDIDQNFSTGVIGVNDAFRPLIGEEPTGLGVDALIDLESEAFHPGFVDIILGAFPVGTAPINFTDSSISIYFPRSILLGAGDLNFAFIVGDSVGPTDAAPSLFGTSGFVPEPSALIQSGLGIFSLACLGCWRYFGKELHASAE